MYVSTRERVAGLTRRAASDASASVLRGDMRARKHGLVASCPFIHKLSKVREGGSFSFVVSADRPLGRYGRSRSSRADVLYTPVLPTLDPVISDSLVPFRWLSQDPPRTLKVQQLHIDRIVNALLEGPSSPHLHHIVRHRECWGATHALGY